MQLTSIHLDCHVINWRDLTRPWRGCYAGRGCISVFLPGRGLCRWVRRVRCGEMGRREERDREGDRREGERLESGVSAWCAARMPSLRADKLQPRPDQRETREEREGLGESRSVAPPDRRDASRRRGSVKKEKKKGGPGGEVVFRLPSFLSPVTQSERERQQCVKLGTQFEKRRR